MSEKKLFPAYNKYCLHFNINEQEFHFQHEFFITSGPGVLNLQLNGKDVVKKA